MVTLDAWESVPPGNETALMQAVSQHPVAVGMCCGDYLDVRVCSSPLLVDCFAASRTNILSHHFFSCMSIRVSQTLTQSQPLRLEQSASDSRTVRVWSTCMAAGGSQQRWCLGIS